MTVTRSYPANNGVDTETPLLDVNALRCARRRLRAPFGLRLAGAENREILNCTAILRHLPGKRLVCRASRPNGESVIVKLFLAPRQAWRHMKRECEGLAALEAARIPTPALICQTSLDDDRTPLVVTTAIPEARSLADCWPGLNERQRKHHLLNCTGLIARLHAAGYCQHDIHPGNFLVAGRDIFLIDGDAIRALTRRSLNVEQGCLTNLAGFIVQFDPDADRWGKVALQAYARHRDWPARQDRFSRFNRIMRLYRYKRMHQRAAKVTRACTAITVRRIWRRYLACDRQWYSATVQPLLDDPDYFVRTGLRLKDGNSATVAQITYKGQPLVIKRYNIKNFRHRLRRCLRPSRGRIAWRNAHMLRLVGIDTPQPRALIEERWGPFRSRAFLICAHQPGQHLADYWKRDWSADDARMNALPPLAALLERLAAAQISHGDLKATNLIFDDGAIALVDLDGLRVYRQLRSFRRQFRKDCDRLLHNWQKHPNIFRSLQQTLANLSITGRKQKS